MGDILKEEEYVGTFIVGADAGCAGGDIFRCGDNFYVRNLALSISHLDGWSLDKLEYYCHIRDLRLKLHYNNGN